MCETFVHVPSDMSPFSSVQNAFWELKCPLSIRERERERVVEDNDWVGERKGECIMAQHVYCGTLCIPFTHGGFQKKTATNGR